MLGWGAFPARWRDRFRLAWSALFGDRWDLEERYAAVHVPPAARALLDEFGAGIDARNGGPRDAPGPDHGDLDALLSDLEGSFGTTSPEIVNARWELDAAFHESEPWHDMCPAFGACFVGTPDGVAYALADLGRFGYLVARLDGEAARLWPRAAIAGPGVTVRRPPVSAWVPRSDGYAFAAGDDPRAALEACGIGDRIVWESEDLP